MYSPRSSCLRRLLWGTVCGMLVAGVTARAADAPRPETPEQQAQRLKWWQEARFGLFVHWGPVSLKGTEIGWSRGGERRGTGSGKGAIPVEVYDTLYKNFNPSLFNAREWVALAKAAGMKYLVFTTKHHDGFSMFDSQLTDYKITNSPFNRDVVKELADACHDAGLGLGFYYSPPDWHHPDYRTDTHAKYIEYLHGQLRELCTNYGKVDIIWFDGLGGKSQDWDSPRLIAMIRSLQPRVIINNRGGLSEDFDTPEQTIGRYQVNRPWESCITICNQWAWKPDDRMKSLQECVQTLVKCAGGDGNLLFNVGPMPTGQIEPRQAERLREMGQWLAKHGETIYATRGGPFRPGFWGCATSRDQTVFLHVMNWETDPLVLPGIQLEIVSSRVLTGGEVQLQQSAETIQVYVAPPDRQPIDTIVALTLDGPAADANPARLPSASVAAGKKASASNVFQKMPQYGPDKALDDDPDTRWATDWGTRQAWLEVDLGQPAAFGRVHIDEWSGAKRIRSFELQAKSGDEWKTFFKGTTVGSDWKQSFPEVTAQVVRLNILDATEGPTINEFHLLPAAK